MSSACVMSVKEEAIMIRLIMAIWNIYYLFKTNMQLKKEKKRAS